MNEKLDIFADLTLTHLGRPMVVRADGRRITLHSGSVVNVIDLYHTAVAHRSAVYRADSFLRAREIGVRLKLGIISMPLLGFGSWKWLRGLALFMGHFRR